MDSEKNLDPVIVSSCIFLENESAETTVKSILAKVSEISKGFASQVVTRELHFHGARASVVQAQNHI